MAENDETKLRRKTSASTVSDSIPVEQSISIEAVSRIGSYGNDFQSAPRDNNERSTDINSFQLYEEKLHAQKKRVKTGEVKISKQIITEEVGVSIPITREKIVIEIESIYGGETRLNIGDARVADDGSMRLDIYEEHAVVCHEIIPKQAVTIRKESVADTVVLGEKVRRETLEVTSEGKAQVDYID